MLIRADQVRPGHVLVLPGCPGREVPVYELTVYGPEEIHESAVAKFPEGGVVISWERIAERGEPGAPRGGDPALLTEAQDCRYLGSLAMRRPDELVKVTDPQPTLYVVDGNAPAGASRGVSRRDPSRNAADVTKAARERQRAARGPTA